MRTAPPGVGGGDLPFGVLGRPHGVSGELILRPYYPGGFAADELPLPLDVILGQPAESAAFVVCSSRRVADGFLVRFEGVASREEAARLTGRELRIPRSALPPLGEAEFYVGDLVGCVVQDLQGNVIGTVKGVFWNGAHDVMSLDGDERLIPVVPEFIVAVEASKKIVTVRLHE